MAKEMGKEHATANACGKGDGRVADGDYVVDDGRVADGDYVVDDGRVADGDYVVDDGHVVDDGYVVGGDCSVGDDRATDGVRTAAVFFVGNKLMLDEGVGPAAYEALQERYVVPANVLLFDVGCMSMDMLPYVRDCDVILTVDAVDGTGEKPGTVFRFPPDAMARAANARASLHDLKLADLFDAAALLGYEAEGYCLGMQVENMYPAEYAIGLTPPVAEALPLLVEAIAAELSRRGFAVVPKA